MDSMKFDKASKSRTCTPLKNLMHHSITLAKEGHSLQAAKKEQIQATCIQEQDAEHNANYAMRFEDIRQRKPYSPRIPYIKHNGL